MRFLLLSLLSLFVSLAVAQDLTTDTMTYKGKVCYVYPYKFEWKKPYRSHRYFQENGEIPPIFDSLPAGDYVMLHAFKPTFKNKRKAKRGKLAPIVGAEFKVENGKLNGKATYYNYKGQKLREGSFYNGLKDGEWIYISFYYDYQKKKSMPYLSEMSTYNKGVLEGPQKELNADGKPTIEYIKKGEGFIDYYKVYYANGQMLLELHADSVTELNYKSLWPLHFAADVLYDTAVHKIDFSRMTQKQLKKYWRTHRYTTQQYVYYDYGTDTYFSDYPDGYSVPSEIPFVMYHENGEVMAKFSGFSSMDKFSLQFDTIYNPLHRPALVKVPLSDSVDHARFRFDYYLADRTLIRQTYYVLDSTNEYKEYRRDMMIMNKLQTTKANYTYFMANNWSGKKLDSLYLVSIDNRYSGTDSTFMSPKIPYQTFTNSLDSVSGFRKYYTILNYDTAMSKYMITLDLGRVKVQGFYHNDSSKFPLEVLTIKDVLKRFIGYKYDYHYQVEEEEQQSQLVQHNSFDSLHILLDGKPFTGNVLLMPVKGEQMFTIKENEIVFNIIAPINFIEINRFGPKSKLIASVQNGRITSINDKGKKFESNYTFKNNMPHGKSTGYIKKGGKRRLAFEINTNEGLYHGESRLFAYKKHKEQKDDSRYYLQQFQRYNMGLLVDTFASYYPNGIYSYMGVNNQEGKGNGDFIDYYRDGTISYYRHFTNNEIDGVFYEINVLGDTIRKGYYSKGKAEGKHFQEHYDVENKIYDYRMWSTYHNGRLEGDFTLHDSYNTLRLELKIDSGQQVFSYLNEETILNDWSGALAFTGEANVYHPNGKKYLNGRMEMGIDTMPDKSHSYYMNKVGVWTYNNTVERKIAELDFVKDAKLIFGTDTITGTANYKAFYPDGSTKYIGVLQFEDTRLNCATDIQESDFVATYSTFISKEGDTLVKNGSGKLMLFNIDDNVSAEGDLKNGKRNGWWRFYNDEGKLIEVGQYIDGEKDGRWLSGDLTGINYLDPQCFVNEEEKQEQQEREKYRISIQEFIYNNGEVVSEQYYQFTRTK